MKHDTKYQFTYAALGIVTQDGRTNAEDAPAAAGRLSI